MWGRFDLAPVDLVVVLTHSSSPAPSPSPPAVWAPAESLLFAIILSVQDAPAFSSPAKLHLVTVPPSTLAKETGGTRVRKKVCLCSTFHKRMVQSSLVKKKKKEKSISHQAQYLLDGRIASINRVLIDVHMLTDGCKEKLFQATWPTFTCIYVLKHVSLPIFIYYVLYVFYYYFYY